MIPRICPGWSRICVNAVPLSATSLAHSETRLGIPSQTGSATEPALVQLPITKCAGDGALASCSTKIFEGRSGRAPRAPPSRTLKPSSQNRTILRPRTRSKSCALQGSPSLCLSSSLPFASTAPTVDDNRSKPTRAPPRGQARLFVRPRQLPAIGPSHSSSDRYCGQQPSAMTSHHSHSMPKYENCGLTSQRLRESTASLRALD